MIKAVRSYGPFLIAFAALLWALDGILRRSLFSLPPITIVFYEHLIGALLILPFFFVAWKKQARPLVRQEWIVMVVVALLSGVLGTLFFTAALVQVGFISFSVVFLLQKLQPIFAIATAAILLKERVTIRYGVWAALAFAAAYFVTFPAGMVNFGEKGVIAAALLAGAAAFAWGSSTAFSRYALIDHSHTVITGLRFFMTVPLAFVGVLLLGQFSSLGALEAGQFGRLFIIALSTGMVALWIYYRGLKFTQAKVSTIVELIFPLAAVFIDIFLYDTVLHWSQYAASAILLFAIYQVSALNKENNEKEKYGSN